MTWLGGNALTSIFACSVVNLISLETLPNSQGSLKKLSSVGSFIPNGFCGKERLRGAWGTRTTAGISTGPISIGPARAAASAVL